jgi:hypothetical protein
MYLAIYSEVDRNISFPQHGDGVKVATANNANLALPTRAARMELFLTWMNGLFARVL